MDTMKKCASCQIPLASDAPDGLCPKCLIKAGLGTGVDIGPDSRGESGRTPFVAPTPEEVARLFPQLEILGFIGQGGMGAVYRARQKALDRVVALKILPPGIGKDTAFAERFAREAKALARLNHPGIVTLYEFGQADGLFFFLMEYVDGMNLRHLLEVERISPREALAIVPQICDALQYAHDQGIVHRDIKPENILLDRQGRVKVADLGLAKLVGTKGEPSADGDAVAGSAVLTEAGKVMGTPHYMAPEQRDHPTDVDHRADIYSLGVVFYQMLTGELPGKPIQPPSHTVRLDVRLDEVVLRALEKEPGRRYQHASQVKSAVETIAQSRPTTDVSPQPADRRTLYPSQSQQVREICAHMTEAERREWTLRGALFGVWNAATFFVPWGIGFFAPKPLNWIVAPILLLVGLAFYPLWRRIEREFLASTRWARQQGIEPESLWMSPNIVMIGRRGDQAVIHWPGVLLSFLLTLAIAEAGAITASLLLFGRIDGRSVGIAFMFALMLVGVFVNRSRATPVERLTVLDGPDGSGPKWGGIVALLLSLGGCVLSLLIGLVFFQSWEWVYGSFYAMETVALILGVVAWDKRTGKAAVVLSFALMLAWAPGVIAQMAQVAPTRLPKESPRRVAAVENSIGEAPRGMAEPVGKPEPAREDGLSPVAPDGWQDQLSAMNQADWRGALATAQKVAALPPAQGVALVRQHWNVVTNAESRKQFLKAFDFADHPFTLSVLDLGLRDPALEVQNWAIAYLKDIALQDLAEDHAAAVEWTSARTNRPLAEVLAASAQAAAARLRTAPPGEVRKQLECLHSAMWYRSFPQAFQESGLAEAIEGVINGQDGDLTKEALKACVVLPVDEAWSRRVLLPFLTPGKPPEACDAAASVLGTRKFAWAVDPLLTGLTNLLSTGGSRVWQLAGALGEIGSPRAIPTLIGAIEADNSYDTIYGVGYFGLGKLTGVKYDAEHNGAWWRSWWDKNKQRFPPEVQALEIPRLSIARAAGQRRPTPTQGDEFRDLTVQACLAGGDTNRLYYLIRKTRADQSSEPDSKLLLVLPGGAGGTNFHPFVKRVAQQAVPSGWLVAQMVAPCWDALQFEKLVWPTKSTPYPAMRFTTEEFAASVIADVRRRSGGASNSVFTLSWSSGGPAAYALSLDTECQVTGSFIAMSVFRPQTLPDLSAAKGRAYYLLHSPQDSIPIAMAEKARETLSTQGARVKLETYEGGHGWHGDVYSQIRAGLLWLGANTRER